MNCFSNGKLTSDSCFGCEIKASECELFNIIQWKNCDKEKPIPYRRLLVEDSDGMVLICRYMNNLFMNIEHDEFYGKPGWSGRVIENPKKWKYID